MKSLSLNNLDPLSVLQVIDVRVDSTFTIENVKELISDQEGIPEVRAPRSNAQGPH